MGFEPTEPVKAQQFSRLSDSTTLAPLRERMIVIVCGGVIQVVKSEPPVRSSKFQGPSSELEADTKLEPGDLRPPKLGTRNSELGTWKAAVPPSYTGGSDLRLALKKSCIRERHLSARTPDVISSR